MGTGAFDLSACARPNILTLCPYRCARDDYEDDGKNVLLDANENAYGPSLDLRDGATVKNAMKNGVAHRDISALDFLRLNRYPDP